MTFALITRQNHCQDILSNYAGDEYFSSEELFLVNVLMTTRD